MSANSPPNAQAVERIAGLIHAYAGIALTDHRQILVEGRLHRRIEHLRLDLDGYANRCERDPIELTILADLLTTSHTAWLREPSHFSDLAERVLPSLTDGRRLRIWCAAAATGEEPYSIALTVAKTLRNMEAWDAAILATDISHTALAKIQQAEYTEEKLAPLCLADRRFALEQRHGTPHTYIVRDHLRRLVQVAHLNLIRPWPMKGPFDVIFCRNVMLYFDQPTRERVVNRLAKLLAPGGTLYIGHTESLNDLHQPLISHGPAIYTF